MEIIIKTTWFPFGTYDAMAMWPFIFLKGSTPLHVLYHERIHLRQQEELLLVGFPLLYALFFVYHFVKNLLLDWDLTFKQCFDKAHEAVPFENEAYKKVQRQLSGGEKDVCLGKRNDLTKKGDIKIPRLSI